jgi:hypothetical protein
MNEPEWREKFLEAVAACSEEGKEAVAYIRARGTHIGLRRVRKNVGAFWWLLTRSVYLNAAHYSHESALVNPGAWGLLIHEVRHLQQGPLVALSIYGELDAWQVQMRLMKKITGRNLHPALEEIISLPLSMDRGNLRRARKLMTDYAGILYGAYLYPLYPLHKEIKYWFTGK